MLAIRFTTRSRVVVKNIRLLRTIPLGLCRPRRPEIMLESLLSLKVRILQQVDASFTKIEVHGHDKGQDSTPSGCRQTVRRNRCVYFRTSSKAPPATFPEGHDPGDVKQET